MTVSDAGKAKYLIKKISQIIPEFIDTDDEKVIDNVIDNIAIVGKQKRSWWPTEDFTFLYTTSPNTNTNLPTASTPTPKPRLRIREVELVINLFFFRIRILWNRK